LTASSAKKKVASTKNMSYFLADRVKLLDFIGRAFFAILFAQAVPGKVTDFASTVDFIVSRGLPEPLATVLLLAAIIILTVGTILFVVAPNTRIGASLLLVFLVPTTLIFHTFPIDSGFVRNLALIGALILAITRSTAGATPNFRDIRRKPSIDR